MSDGFIFAWGVLAFLLAVVVYPLVYRVIHS